MAGTQSRARNWGKILTVLKYALLAVGGVVMIFPFLDMFLGALRTPAERLSLPMVYWPRHPQWHNFVRVFTEIPMLTWFANSVFVTVSITIIQMLTSTMAGYALAKYRFFGSKVLLRAVLAAQMFPFFLLIIPMFFLLRFVPLAGGNDGWVLPSGNLLLTISKDNDYPGGGVVEVTRDGKVLFEYKGAQSEVNTSQALPNGNILLTEAGAKPRILEVDRAGKIVVDVPISCQLTNHHMQSRMTRKLPNGNYLVPQLFDKVVREYNSEGKIVWEVKTPNWPFTAIRLPNGNTLINCTYGHLSIEVDRKGNTVWQLSNADLPEAFIKDACGGQRLPNGNSVITSYGVGAKGMKLLEVTRDKKLVWTYTDSKPGGIHHFQILDTNGKPIKGDPLR